MEPLLCVNDGSARATAGGSAHETAHGRRGHVNYQSTATTTTTSGSVSGSGTRPRRTAASHDSRRPEGEADAGHAKRQWPSWWTSWLASVQSIELENKGSVARDHLALERTFLAWLRTSLAFASIGIAVTQLFRLNMSDRRDDDGLGSGHGAPFDNLQRVGRPLGSTFLGISIIILFLGYHRYHQSQQWILRGKFPASRGTILLVSLVALALMVASLVVVVVVQPHD